MLALAMRRLLSGTATGSGRYSALLTSDGFASAFPIDSASGKHKSVLFFFLTQYLGLKASSPGPLHICFVFASWAEV